MLEDQAIPKATLEVIQPVRSRHIVYVYVTRSPFLIGRGAEAGNDLQLAGRRICRNCAALIGTDGEFFLEDCSQRQVLIERMIKTHLNKKAELSNP